MKRFIFLTTIVSLFLIISSCSTESKKALSSLSEIENQEYSISLEEPVLLKEDNRYNLHWNSNLPDHKVAYDLSVNGKLIKRNLTKTVISDGGSVIEFNVPVTDYGISTNFLGEGVNSIQIIASYNNTEIHKSNKVEVEFNKSDYLASK